MHPSPPSSKVPASHSPGAALASDFRGSRVTSFQFSRLTSPKTGHYSSGRTIGGDSSYAMSVLFSDEDRQPASMGVSFTPEHWAALTRLWAANQDLFQPTPRPVVVSKDLRRVEKVRIEIHTATGNWVCQFPLEDLKGESRPAQFARQFEALFSG